MGKTRHGIGGVFRRARHQRPHKILDLQGQAIDGVPHPEAKVRRHLVVAAATGMEAAAGIADPVGEPRLDVHMDVFERRLERETPGLDLGGDGLKAAGDGALVGGGNDPSAGQHRGMGT